MTGYGEVVRETADERHERHVEAIGVVLWNWLLPHVGNGMTREKIQSLAEECLAAAETGF